METHSVGSSVGESEDENGNIHQSKKVLVGRNRNCVNYEGAVTIGRTPLESINSCNMLGSSCALMPFPW
jgi:hypothetical protein